MNQDMSVGCGEGFLNIRVGAIIFQDGKILMVTNDRVDYYYSIGGRIKMGETAQEAIVREVYEETGYIMSVDRLGFIHENYFYGDAKSNKDKLIYEISFYFIMNVPKDFYPITQSTTEDHDQETYFWTDLKTSAKLYPEFFKTHDLVNSQSVIHLVTDQRKKRMNTYKG